jgi:hypothetical protein
LVIAYAMLSNLYYLCVLIRHAIVTTEMYRKRAFIHIQKAWMLVHAIYEELAVPRLERETDFGDLEGLSTLESLLLSFLVNCFLRRLFTCVNYSVIL